MKAKRGLIGDYTFAVLVLSTLFVGAPLMFGAAPGTFLWFFPASGPAVGTAVSPAIGCDGTIYAGSGDGTLYALTGQGSNVWAFHAASAINSCPAVGDDGTIYFGCDDGKLYSVNSGGKLRWTWGPVESPFTPGPIRSSPALGRDGAIYIGAGGGLHAVGTNGMARWNFVVDEVNYTDSLASPAIGDDGTIYMLSGKLFALRPDGSKKWEFAEGHDSIVSLYRNEFDSVAIVSDGTLVFSGTAASLYAVDTEGRERWHTNGIFEHGGNPGLFKIPAVASDGTIHAIASYRNGANFVFAFAPDGTQRWYAGGSGRYSDGFSPSVDSQGNTYFAASGWLSYHEYYGLAANGSTNWTLPYGEYRVDGPVTIGRDGTLYVWAASVQGAGLYAFAGASGPSHTHWPMHRQNARQTGKVEWPRLRSLNHSVENVQVEVFADLGWNCTVQSSSNLFQWLSLTNFIAETNRTVITETLLPDAAQRFYRVVSPTP